MILAGVSLSFVFNGGILDKSQQAVNEYENASQTEQDLLDKIDKYLENELGEIANDEPKVPSVDENGLATEDTIIVAKDDPSIQIVIPEGFAPAILQTGTTQSLPGENGAVKEIMPAEKWNDITKEDINSGVVVVDNAITYDNGQPTGNVSDFNEYVWIPMPDMSKFSRIAWITPYGYDENGNYINGEIMHLLANESTENRWWEEESSLEYLNIINSVSINKGFYIGRYESSQKNETTAQSKRGQNPWTSVSQITAITASKNVDTSINSHLIYGIEFDSILNWFLESKAKIAVEENELMKEISLNDIQKDSKNWGNYKDSIGGASVNSGVKQPSGTSEYWKVNNIYDLAGNVYEWTQEKFSTGNFRTARGGTYNNLGIDYPVADRNRNYEDSSNDSYGRI